MFFWIYFKTYFRAILGYFRPLGAPNIPKEWSWKIAFNYFFVCLYEIFKIRYWYRVFSWIYIKTYFRSILGYFRTLGAPNIPEVWSWKVAFNYFFVCLYEIYNIRYWYRVFYWIYIKDLFETYFGLF